MSGKRLSDFVAAIDPASPYASTVSTSTLSKGTTLTMNTLNEAMESLMALTSSNYDSQMDRERYEYERMMHQRMVRYDSRTMDFKPYGNNDNLSVREINRLESELQALKKENQTKKAERVKSRETLIAYYYSMRPAGVKAVV